MPERSRLHHLEPIGIGTPKVESLTSFVTRLANSHEVFPSILLSRVINPLLQQTFIKNYTSRGLKTFFNRSHALNGYGTIATDFSNVINQLTLHNQLQFLTLIPFSNILVTKGLLRPYKAWCPICYQEWKQNKHLIYDLLLWTLKDVTVCLIHQYPLIQNCPHCCRQIHWLSWKSNLGYCSYCSQWLGIAQNKAISNNSQIVNQERWMVNALGELLANAYQLSSLLTPEHIQKSFNIAVEKYTDGNIAAFAAMHQIPKNTCWGWYTGKNCPSLSALLQICYSLRLSLSQFLMQDFQQTATTLNKLTFERQSSKKARLSPQNFNLELIENTLTTILSQSSESLPTLIDVAKQLNINRRLLSRHFPELCRQIVDKRRHYQHLCHIASIDKCCLEIEEAIITLGKLGEYPTEARVCELISNPGYFRYKKVRLLYKKEVQSIIRSL
ncbi:TetR family transcriptional regulator [Chroococcus sp. FPU101]|nr:TetR family transcriptional regulator [Chroococcus sp. FPU101]